MVTEVPTPPKRKRREKPVMSATLQLRMYPEQLHELEASAEQLGVDTAYVARRALALGLLPAEQEIQAAIDDALER